MSKVIVVGGGAAGMLAAIGAAENYNEVLILEKNEKLGKKIFITGKGRCNLTNSSDMDIVMKNVVSNGKFLFSAFKNFSNDDIISLLNEEGISTKVERGNRVFPESDKSYDVIEGLKRRLKKLNVKVRLNTKVKKLSIQDDRVNGVYIDSNDNEYIYADYVIIATGGYSYQSTGSDGDGYRFAQETGHNVTKVYPALVPLVTEEKYVADISGLALRNVKVSLFIDEKVVYSDFGEMLFTHFGVSGPTVLSGSSYITNAINNKRNVSIKIDLKPALDEATLDARILREFEENINKDFRNSLDALLPKSLIPIIVSESNISPYKKVNEITKEERSELINALKNLTLHIVGTRDFNEAIITQGGISTKDINPSTMESKKIAGLHFAGEVLDVDALTGGYNLQVAWSTGYTAGNSIY